MPMPVQTPPNVRVIELPDEHATLATGESLGRWLATQSVALALHLNLIGDLGAGKTTLVRGVLRGLGFAGRVKSPTYPLLETYTAAERTLAHFDLYRLETPEAFTEAGFDEYFIGPGLRFVEWPERATGVLPPADGQLMLDEAANGGRVLRIEALSIEALSAHGADVLAGFMGEIL